MKAKIILIILFFSFVLKAQNTTPVLEVCDFGIENLNAELHSGRLVNSTKILANFTVNDTIKKIDYLRLTILFNRKNSKTQLAFLKKSLIDKYSIKPSEILFDHKANSIEITKTDLPNYKDVSTHFITLYLNQKIADASLKLFLKSGKKLYESSFLKLKNIKSK